MLVLRTNPCKCGAVFHGNCGWLIKRVELALRIIQDNCGNSAANTGSFLGCLPQNWHNGRKIVNSSISCRRWCKGPPWLPRITENLGSTLKREPERRLPFLRKAAGAKISQCSMNEEVKGHINTHLMCDWNEVTLKPSPSSHWRESLVPAAAVIPAPVAYAKVAAIKTAVVVISGGVFHLWRRSCYC